MFVSIRQILTRKYTNKTVMTRFFSFHLGSVNGIYVNIFVDFLRAVFLIYWSYYIVFDFPYSVTFITYVNNRQEAIKRAILSSLA